MPPEVVANASAIVGDANPMHADTTFANELGLPDIVAPGSFLACVLMAARDQWRPEWVEVRVKFSRWAAAGAEWSLVDRGKDIALFAGDRLPAATLRPIRKAENGGR